MRAWLDRNEIAPGQRWKDAVRRALQGGTFYLACFSQEYSDRDRSHMNEELTLAVEELRLRPTDRAWFIPVVLSGPGVPDRDIGGGATLRDIQWVDLTSDWARGVQRMIGAIKSPPPRGPLTCLRNAGLQAPSTSAGQGQADLVRKMFALEKPQLLDLIRRVGPPDGILPPKPSLSAEQIESLVVWAASPNGCTLDHVHNILNALLNPYNPPRVP